MRLDSITEVSLPGKEVGITPANGFSSCLLPVSPTSLSVSPYSPSSGFLLPFPVLTSHLHPTCTPQPTESAWDTVYQCGFYFKEGLWLSGMQWLQEGNTQARRLQGWQLKSASNVGQLCPTGSCSHQGHGRQRMQCGHDACPSSGGRGRVC